MGIVLGLIVGLAIAVVVALYITRAPSPFVSKVAPLADSGVSSTCQVQQFDSNRAQGRVQPVPPVAQPTPPNTVPDQAANQKTQPPLLPEPQIVEVPGSKGSQNSNLQPSSGDNSIAVVPRLVDNTPPAKKPQTTAAASSSSSQLKPIQQAVKPTSPAQVGNAPAKPGSGSVAGATALDTNSSYFLQVGAYKTEADAEQQRARLGFQGFESKVSKRDVSGITYYRVRVGPFNKLNDLNTTRQRLSNADVDTAVIRFTK
ncbi:MAG: Cell division protein FtsN [Burkholderia gladioli]|nr:MAG: Cell division protein FtsN [Burkholderia gladioli]